MENIMREDNLATLKGNVTLVSQCGTRIEPKKHYRCIALTEGDETQILVNGIVFDKDAFNELFLYTHDVIMDEMSEIGLLPMMKPLTKTAFVELMDLHQYGKGKRKLYVAFFGDKMNGIIAFYPSFAGDTKARFLKEAYENYQQVLNGNMSLIDSGIVQRGNSGIPIGYGDIYFRKAYNPNNEKNEIYC